MKTPIVLNRFTIDRAAHSDAHGIEFKDKSLTVQADVQQADINFIVKQFGLTHQLPYGRSVPEFADYSDVPNDYHQAMMFIQDSDEAFMLMPAEVRSRFDNDAGKFLAFVSDAANRDEAVSLGLVPRPPVDGVPDSQVPDDFNAPKPIAGTDASGGS